MLTAAIPRGEKISAENAEQYITVMEIDKRIVPETALKSTEAASGRIAAYGVEQGMVLTTGMLRELSEITEQMRERNREWTNMVIISLSYHLLQIICVNLL